MQDADFIIREPLLNGKEQVIGYELSMLSPRASQSAASDALAHAIAAEMEEREGGALLREQLLCVRSTAHMLTSGFFSSLPPKKTLIGVQVTTLTDENVQAAVKTLRAAGFGILLLDADLTGADKGLLGLATHLALSAARSDFAAQVQVYRSMSLTSLQVVVRDIANWQHFDICAKLGFHVFAGKLVRTTRPTTRAGGLNPAQTMIMNLMEMVRQNADVRQLESVLKRDAAVSYKLLRYINSAGFGLGCEIQSLRHAVTLLGYSPLYRWLALLLATATSSSYSPVLMQTAIIRGRFAELMGQNFLPRQEAENLFVAGMFSLLDKLVGIPMEKVLEKIQLSNQVSEALLTRRGIYGPFLALAEACERNTPDIDSLAMALCIDAGQVNKAHLSALVWAQSLQL